VNKKILIVSIVLAIAVSGGMVYLERVVLPVKVKAIIIEELEKATGKRCAIHSVNFNIFKGLVLRDLIIYEKNIAIINSKEVSCAFLIPPLFKKETIIPSMRFESPEIFVQRRPDNSINIIELFKGNKISNSRFKLLVRKVSLRGATINFHDDTMSPPFAKKIDKINADIYLSLPAKARFKLEFGVSDDPLLKITSAGDYNITQGELKADIDINDLAPGMLGRYYERLNLSFPEGRCNSKINLSSKGGVLKLNLRCETRGLSLSKDKIAAKIDSDIKSEVIYNVKDKEINYSGRVDLANMSLTGIGGVERLDDVKGNLAFDNSGISSDDISAEVFGIPVKGKLALTDFSSPAVNVGINANVSLGALQKVLKEKFEITLPAGLEGEGKLWIALEYKVSEKSELLLQHVGGWLDESDAKIIISRNKPALENVSGKFNFTGNQLTWAGLVFKYLGTSYETSGMLTNFDSPGVQMKLTSKNLSLESIFGVNGKLITFSRLSGVWFDSEFSMEGRLDLTDASSMSAELAGTADIVLSGLKEPFKKFKEKIDKIKPSGTVHAEFSLKGDLNDIRSCSIEASLSSAALSIYNIKPSNIYINYRQKNGAAEIPFIRAALYGGTMDASAKFDILSKELPYSASVDVNGAKLELMKSDIGLKDKEISGVLNVKGKIAGYSDDVSRLSGSGKVTISDGKLWQLNLFQGLGVLLFTSDFSNIIFRDGACDFFIRDKALATDNLALKSDLIGLYGPVKIDFQGSVQASLKAELQEEALDSGTRKSITTAIGKYSMIEIAGTLKEPKYRLRPDVGGIIEDIAERVFQQ